MKKFAVLFTFSLLLAATSNTFAATEASTEASLDVIPDCSISATDIDMGIYNSRTGANGTGTVRIKCNVDFRVRNFGYTERLIGDSVNIPYNITYSGTNILGSKQLRRSVPGNNKRKFIKGCFDPFSCNDLSDNDRNVIVPTGVGNDAFNTYILDAVVDPGLWVPAGQYSQIINFEMEFPFPRPRL
jgi:hypothetical protein